MKSESSVCGRLFPKVSPWAGAALWLGLLSPAVLAQVECPETNGVKHLQRPNLINGMDVDTTVWPVAPNTAGGKDGASLREACRAT